LLAVGTTSTNLEILEPEPDVFSTSFEPEPAVASDTTSTEAQDGETSASVEETSTSVGETSTSVTSASADTSSSASPTSPAAASGSTTSTAPESTHAIAINVDLSSVDSLTTESELLNKITQGLEAAAADAGVSVEVAISSMQLISVYGDLPTIDVDDIAEAIANMSSVELDQIKVNGQMHSSLSRRLLETATCITTVNKSVDSDIVAELKRIEATQTANSFTNQLRSVNATAYQNVNASLTSAPTIKIQATTNVRGLNAPPSTAEIEAQIANRTGGTVDVTSVTSSGVASSSTQQNIPADVEQVDHAPIAPMLTIWAIAYVFAMN
jgi:hypothetical protein